MPQTERSWHPVVAALLRDIQVEAGALRLTAAVREAAIAALAAVPDTEIVDATSDLCVVAHELRASATGQAVGNAIMELATAIVPRLTALKTGAQARPSSRARNEAWEQFQAGEHARLAKTPAEAPRGTQVRAGPFAAHNLKGGA